MQCTKWIVRGARCIPSCSKRLSLYLPSIVHHIILPYHWQPQFYNDVSSSILGMAQFKIWISHDSGKPCRMHAPTRHESTCPECPPHPHWHHHSFPQINTNLRLDNMRRDNLTFCDAFFWGFDAHSPAPCLQSWACCQTHNRFFHRNRQIPGLAWNSQFSRVRNMKWAILWVRQ